MDSNTRAIKDMLGARLLRGDLNYMDVKMMSEILERNRARVQAAIKHVRTAQAAARTQKGWIARHYTTQEVIYAQEAVTAALLLWRMSHKDYHAMYRAYLAKCRGPHLNNDWARAA